VYTCIRREWPLLKVIIITREGLNRDRYYFTNHLPIPFQSYPNRERIPIVNAMVAQPNSFNSPTNRWEYSPPIIAVKVMNESRVVSIN